MPLLRLGRLLEEGGVVGTGEGEEVERQLSAEELQRLLDVLGAFWTGKGRHVIQNVAVVPPTPRPGEEARLLVYWYAPATDIHLPVDLVVSAAEAIASALGDPGLASALAEALRLYYALKGVTEIRFNIAGATPIFLEEGPAPVDQTYADIRAYPEGITLQLYKPEEMSFTHVPGEKTVGGVPARAPIYEGTLYITEYRLVFYEPGRYRFLVTAFRLTVDFVNALVKWVLDDRRRTLVGAGVTPAPHLALASGALLAGIAGVGLYKTGALKGLEEAFRRIVVRVRGG